jgi:putative heme-binding domain-containing protein
LNSLQRMLEQTTHSGGDRRRWMEILVARRVDGLEKTLENLLTDRTVAADAVEALGALGAPESAETLIGTYSRLDPRARREAINTLVSRPGWVLSLLNAVQRGHIPKKEISASHLRQLRSMNPPDIQEKVARIWPGTTGSERNLYQKYRTLLSESNLQKTSVDRGRELYQLSCAPCHKLYGEGTSIGPELTGSDRHNLDYLLENILSPSGIVPEAYRVSNVNMKDDRSLSGMIISMDDQSVTLQTLTEKLTLPKTEIESIQHSELSMMPDGLLENLSDQQVLDLVKYLQSGGPSGGATE